MMLITVGAPKRPPSETNPAGTGTREVPGGFSSFVLVTFAGAKRLPNDSKTLMWALNFASVGPDGKPGEFVGALDTFPPDSNVASKEEKFQSLEYATQKARLLAIADDKVHAKLVEAGNFVPAFDPETGDLAAFVMDAATEQSAVASGATGGDLVVQVGNWTCLAYLRMGPGLDDRVRGEENGKKKYDPALYELTYISYGDLPKVLAGTRSAPPVFTAKMKAYVEERAAAAEQMERRRQKQAAAAAGTAGTKQAAGDAAVNGAARQAPAPPPPPED